ncbi:MAG: preprotein translocase subunit SecE [Candidatus Onthoplasma sp.]
MENKTPKQETKVETKPKVVEVKAKDVSKNKKKDKPKKPNKVAKALKDTGNELKKVTWPTFKQVAKQTGIVLVVVLVFMLVLLGFDKLCEFLTGFLY